MNTFNKTIWLLLTIFFLIATSGNVFYSKSIEAILPILLVLCPLSIVILHGLKRYGSKNMLFFLLITWAISHFFEAVSIQTGFPFGYYHYDKLIGPRLFQVPLIIMFAYFSMIYTSWMLAHVLLHQYSRKLQGQFIFFIPLVAAFIMVMWDLCIDPQASTIVSLWVWPQGGAYFGVPLKNYFGWFLVVYLILQTFALYIAKFDKISQNALPIVTSKSFWFQITTVYAIQTLLQLLNPVTQTQHMEIYAPIALIAIFTMLFVTLLTYILITIEKSVYV